MNDFDYDALQKKRIAQGDRHRKRGSRSRKCSLPQDYMTPAQLRRMNGPMKTYNLNAPLSWYEFCQMPEDLQRQYLDGLRAKYNATNEMLGELFHVHPTTVSQKRTALGCRVRCHALSVEARAERTRAWMVFLSGAAEITEEAGSSLEEIVPIQPDDPGPSDPEKAQNRYLDRMGFSAEFTGPFNLESLASWLAAFPIHGTPDVRIKVEVEIKGGEADEVPTHAAPADRH